MNLEGPVIAGPSFRAVMETRKHEFAAALEAAARKATTAGGAYAAARAAKALRECGTPGMMGAAGPGPGRVLRLRFEGGAVKFQGVMRCKHKLCGECQRRRGGRLAGDMAGVLDFLHEAWGFGPHRTRFCTFTVPNVESVKEGFDWIADAWHKVLSGKVWGRMVAGGFRCFEVKPGKDGKWNVHLHAVVLLWSPLVSYKAMREAWDRAAGMRCNMRFDTLRGVKARNGKSKAACVAAYIAKYLVKFEDAAAAERAPGGLAHLAECLQGRRLWAAWGVAATARRWVRMAKPEWMDRARAWIAGYRGPEGEPLAGVELVDTTTGEAVELPHLVRPWQGTFGGDPPELLDLPPEALAFTWFSAGPLPIFKGNGRWIGWRAWWAMTSAERRPTRYRDHFRAVYRPKLDTEPSDYGQLDYSRSPFRASAMLSAFIRRTFNHEISRVGWNRAVGWADKLPDHLRAVIIAAWGRIEKEEAQHDRSTAETGWIEPEPWWEDAGTAWRLGSIRA